ncbi:acetyl-coenzyme A carboxylase carboxyl transferase subunit beta, partial [Vibrio parahaemolyticus 10296]
VLVLLMP